MNDRALIIALVALCLIIVVFLTGCETLRIGLTTDYGTFSYQVPTRTLRQVKDKYKEVSRQTPNFSKGRVIHPTAVVLHHTSGSYAGGVSWCMNPASQVSYHVIIAPNGERTVLAGDNQRAWHAGVSSWKGRKDLNSWSLGVAFAGIRIKNL
jgi:N-acetyl-anhydromuramyl-L-alanine amidase AmpD